jgi:hypothetical protein
VRPLCEAPARLGRGPLAPGGRLWLEADRLRFAPEGRLGRWTGARPVDVELRSVEEIELNGGLGLRAGREVWWFAGAAAARLGWRLEAALLHLRGQPGDSAPDERVWVQADARWEGDGGARGRGDLILTDRRVILREGGAAWDRPFGALRAAEREQSSGALVVDDGLSERIVHASEVGYVLALIRAAHGGRLGDEPPVWPAGTALWVGAGPRLELHPDRALPGAGLAPVRGVAIDAVDRAGLDDAGLRVGAGEVELLAPGAPEAWAWLRAALDARMQRWLSDGLGWGGAAAAAVGAAHRAARAALPPADGEPGLRFFAPGLWIDGPLLRGCTVAFGDGALSVLPAGDAPLTVVPEAALVRSPGASADELCLSRPPLRVRLAGGAGAVEALWAACAAPSRRLEGAQIGAEVIARLCGEPRYARILIGADERASFTPARLRPHPRGLLLGGDAPAPHGLPAGPALVELGLPDGVYQVQTALLGPADLQGVRGVLLAPPGRIEVFNRRRAYRAPFDALAVGPGLWLADLSATGVGLLVDLPLGPGDRVELSLPLPGAPARLRAEVVRRAAAPQGRARLGLRLLGVDAATGAAVVGLALRRQLELLSGRLEAADLPPPPTNQEKR